MAATAAAFSQELLTLWTRDPALAASASTITVMLMIGTAINGAMHFPYALHLASGATSLPLTINAILVTIMVPLTIGLATEFGAMGGAMAWLLLNFLYLLIGTWLTHRTLLRGKGVSWLLNDVAVPAAVSALIVGLSSLGIKAAGLSNVTTIVLGCGVAAVCILGLLLMTHRTRVAIQSMWSLTNR